MVSPLMMTTLPTIIGMGVVSKATTELFGKGKSQTAAARKSRGVRKFNGKVYEPANWHTSKAIADRDAGHFRNAGHSARVVKSYNTRLRKSGYRVYVR